MGQSVVQHSAVGGIMLTYHNILTESEKQDICNWHYTGNYAIYNLPAYDSLVSSQQGIANPANAGNYYAFYDKDIFVGYINLIQRNNKFSVGIAVRPDLCSQGYGRQMLLLCDGIAAAICPGKPLGLQVRSWNKRAIKCYQNAGYVITGDEYELTTPSGKGMFYRMIKQV